jgi:hypothetical protein
MSDGRTIDPGARTDAEALPSPPPVSVDRIASFLFVLGAILLFLSAFLITVRGFERFLQSHFQQVVDSSIQIPVSPQSPAERIRINLTKNVENSNWVRIWGVKVGVVVKARDERTWLYVNGQPKILRYPNRDPKIRKELNARLLPATATVTTSVRHNTILFSSVLIVYAAIFLTGFFVHNRRVVNEQIRVIDDARDSRNQAASTARRIEKELGSVRAQLDEIMRLQSEQQELRARLDQLVTRERELRGQADRAVTLEEDSRVLEEMLEEATGNLAAKETEIRELEKSLKGTKKSIGAAGGKSRSKELLAKRMRTLYPRLEFDDHAMDDLVALPDEGTRLRAEECIKRLAEDAENLGARRKVGGLPNHLSIYELRFAGKRRLYYAKVKDGRFRVLVIGAKNTQRTDVDYLWKIPKGEIIS